MVAARREVLELAVQPLVVVPLHPLEGGVLDLHKTRVVYCKDSRRTKDHENVAFDFLGYTFRPREIVDADGRLDTGFTPALSRSSMTAMRQAMRRRRLHHRSEWTLDDLARAKHPRVRAWMAYCCRFRGSEFQVVANHFDEIIVRWAVRKFKRLRGHKGRAYAWLDRQRRERPAAFAHRSGRGAFAVGAMGAR